MIFIGFREEPASRRKAALFEDRIAGRDDQSTRSTDGSPRSELVSPCLSLAEASELTHDLARLGERRTPGGDVPGGEIDRRTFVRPGLYLFPRAVLDTRTLAVHRIEIPESVAEVIIKSRDLNGDKVLSFDEFWAYLSK